jgi:hypothetical protein
VVDFDELALKIGWNSIGGFRPSNEADVDGGIVSPVISKVEKFSGGVIPVSGSGLPAVKGVARAMFGFIVAVLFQDLVGGFPDDVMDHACQSSFGGQLGEGLVKVSFFEQPTNHEAVELGLKLPRASGHPDAGTLAGGLQVEDPEFGRLGIEEKGVDSDYDGSLG